MEQDDITSSRCVELHIGRKGEAAWLTPQSLKGYTFDRVLGSGTSGTVFDAHRDDDSMEDQVAIKTEFASEEFKRECSLMKRMSRLGVCPMFVSCWIKEGVGFLATEKWDISLSDWIKRNKINRYSKGYPLPSFLISRLRRHIEKMHSHNYVHGDLMEKNIMLRLDRHRRPVDICLTDFGLTMHVQEWSKHLSFLKTLFEYHMNDCNYTDRYFRENRIEFSDVVKDPKHLDRALLYYMETRSK